MGRSNVCRQISSFCETRWRNISPVRLSKVLQQCIDLKALGPGKQIHHLIIISSLSSTSYLTTKLVQFYADCDNIAPAYKLFNELPQPNVFACTAILAFYSRNGEHDNCFRSYGETRAHGVEPDGYVFPVVLKSCTQLKSLKCGTQIHNDIIKFGTESVLHVCNSLVDMYSKCGHIEGARHVFNEMAERNLLSWNTLMSGYVCNDQYDSAVELLSVIRGEGFEPDLVTWNTIIDAYSRMGHFEEVYKIFSQIRKPNIITWTTLILGFSRSGKHENALSFFREMIHQGDVLPDLDILSCVISSCRHLEATRQGQEIHGYGIRTQMGYEFHDTVGSALITMYSACNRVQDAKNIFGIMDKCTIITWNAIISGFSQLGLGDLAVYYFLTMQLNETKYDQLTISTILPVCGLKFGKQIHAHVLKNCSNVSLSVCNALISMYTKCGYIGPAYSIFSKMQKRDAITWNTMIGGFGMNGYGKVALALLQDMRQSDSVPNSVTMTVALSTCSHLGLVDEGVKLFNSMTGDYGIDPTIEHFSCIVDLFARDGQLDDAFNFLSNMPIEPNASMWGSLLSSCQVHQHVEFAEAAAYKLFYLEPDNPGNYVTLANIYARANRRPDSIRVRKLMESRGLNKPSGCSWM